MKRYNDDEQIDAIPEQDAGAAAGSKQEEFREGNTKMTIMKEAQEGNKLKVIVQLTGETEAETEDISVAGVDFVVVLDICTRMKSEKFKRMKSALQLLISKLRQIDRLSIVTFSMKCTRPYPLSWMTERGQAKAQGLVNDLSPQGRLTNVAEGLKTALQVLDDRRISSRDPAILLLSDGKLCPLYEDATKLPVFWAPVYTFGFGDDYESDVLKDISSNSRGGMFSVVDDDSSVFSECLAHLLGLAAQDLKLTVTPVESKINNVFAGICQQSTDDATGSVTVSFTELYMKEKRMVIVELCLPTLTCDEKGVDVLKINDSFNSKGKKFCSAPILVSVARKSLTTQQGMDEVILKCKAQQLERLMDSEPSTEFQGIHERPQVGPNFAPRGNPHVNHYYYPNQNGRYPHHPPAYSPQCQPRGYGMNMYPGYRMNPGQRLNTPCDMKATLLRGRMFVPTYPHPRRQYETGTSDSSKSHASRLM